MKNTTQYLKLLGMVCLGLASLPVRAGDQTFNFDTDPSLDPLFKLVGNNAASAWFGTGGNPASGGYLELTPALGGQSLCIVFPDVDQGYPVKAFKVTMDCRVGNGTARPADGFSINYCREGDVVLVNATNGVTGGAAGGDSDAQTTDPAGSGDLENGTKTGVAIVFDSWAGNRLPDTGPGGTPGPDTEGIAVRVDDKTLRSINMEANRNGGCTYDATTQPDISVCQAAACAATNSIQTGPYDGSSSVDVLCWQPLIVELDINKQITVTWKGAVILDHYQLSQYSPHRGRLVIMGRTGGSHQNVNFDNIRVETTPAIEATYGSLTGVGLNGFKFTIDDNGISTVTNVPMVKLDGVDVTSSVTVTKVGPQTTVSYSQAANFDSGSRHTVDATWKTSLNQTLSQNGQTFTVMPWVALPESYAVTGVDTSRPGFIIQPYQTTAGNPNRLYWTDEQLLGKHGANLVDLTSVSGVTNANYVAWNDVIDFSNDAVPGANGQFFHDLDWANLGIPGTGAANDDNSSMAVMAYAHFPAAGTYVFGGNSDDGIRLTFAPASHSIVGLEVPGMTADVGRGIGANQNSGGVVVTKPGYYAFRYLFENGGGGCNVELYTKETPAGVANLLVNDSTNANSLKVYMVSTAAPPYVSDANPTMNNDTVWPNATLTYKLTDSGTTVDQSKVTLSVDAVVQAPTVSKAGNVTTVTLAHTGAAWASASTHTVDLGYQDNLGTNYTASYSFKVLAYAAVPSVGVPLGSEDAAKPGFVMNIRAADPQGNAGAGNLANRIHVGEQVLAGLYGPNVTTVPNPVLVPGTINYDINAASQGDFNAGNGYPEELFPGIPSTSINPLESFAAEWMTWVEFKTAGIYGMCVNSDDGFLTKVGVERPTQIGQITVTSPTSIAGDKVAVFAANGGAGLPVTNTITAKVVMYQDTSGNNLGSLAATNAAALAGNIALVQRGTSGFAVKAANALAAGAAAVIIGQNRPDANPADGRFPIEAGGAPTAAIATVMTDLVTYQALTNALGTGEVMATLNPMDMSAAVGSADYGKGASQINFNVYIPAPGLYPFRTMFWQGGGGGNAEWSTFDSTGTHILLNDLTNPNGLRAFQAVKVTPKPTMSIATTGGVTKITYTGTLQSSGTANGTYTDVSGATSPYTVNTSTGSQFYRSRN